MMNRPVKLGSNIYSALRCRYSRMRSMIEQWSECKNIVLDPFWQNYNYAKMTWSTWGRSIGSSSCRGYSGAVLELHRLSGPTRRSSCICWLGSWWKSPFHHHKWQCQRPQLHTQINRINCWKSVNYIDVQNCWRPFKIFKTYHLRSPGHGPDLCRSLFKENQKVPVNGSHMTSFST